jgi:cephalosporin hydroxylase
VGSIGRYFMAIKDKETYKGKKIKQVKGIVEIFDSFFEKEKFDNIIEIGSGVGVFSIYFASKARDMKASFITCDVKMLGKQIRNELKSFDTNIITGDVNKNDYVKKVVSDSGRCLILNDGDKFNSFNTYGPKLKPGDYMFIHDYYYMKKGIFDGLATWDDFEKGIKKFNLIISDYTEIFKKYLWMCIKRGI